METLIVFSSIIIFFTVISAQTCRPDSCDDFLGPEVRFPFRLRERQLPGCGYPGFDLHCNSQNQTIIYLPESGEFIVDEIDYIAQSFFISDPDSCLSSRVLNLTLSGSPYRRAYSGLYDFFNCSSNWTEQMSSLHLMPLFCISGSNYTVVAANSPSSEGRMPSRCRRVADGTGVPMRWPAPNYWPYFMWREDVELGWNEPLCGDCETQGGICRFAGGSGLQIGCSMPSRTGLPKGAKYGVIIGVGIPGLLCIIGLAYYICGIIGAIRHRRHLTFELPTAISGQQPSIRSAPGLDRPTIESYPMTMLGESRRLPKPNDSTCSICLCDYMPKDILRSIPECNHYFHSDCIDEWLKLNGTCPLCRNSPEGSSSSATPSPSSSLSMSPSDSTSSDGP